MIINNINPKRYEFLAKTIGIYLQEFFKTKNKTLGAMKVPIRSIPSNAQQAINLFITLPDKALPLIREWFTDKLKDEKLPDPKQAIAAFVLNELNLQEQPTNEEIRLYGQSVFLNLIAESPLEEVLRFMSLPMGIATEDVPSPGLVSRSERAGQVDANVICSSTASEILADLDPLELRYLCQVERVSDPNGIAFLKPLSFYTNDGSLYQCTAQEWLDLLPNEGNIIWYGLRNSKRHLQQGEYGVFSIRDVNDSTKSIKYAVDEFQYQAYPIIDCPLTIKDLDKLRSWFVQNQMVISNNAAYVRISGNHLLKPIVLSNGNIDLEKPVEVFTDSPFISTANKLFCEHLGKSELNIDLSSPEVFLKKFLNRNSEPFKAIPRDVLALLSDELKATKEGFTAEKVKQLLFYIDEISEKRDAVDLFVAQFQKTDIVKGAIERQISEAVEKSSKEIEAINSKIKELQKTRDNLIKSVEKEQEKHKKERQALYSDIKSTFERGMADGRKTLAEAALFGAILGPTASSSLSSNGDITAFKNFSSRFERVLSPKPEPYEDIFKKLRFKTNDLSSLFKAVEALFKIGITPAFQGNSARIFAKALANNTTVENVIEVMVSPGMESSNLLADPGSELLSNSSVILYNFNLAPINVYAHELLDGIYGKFLAGKNIGPNVILTFDDSGLGLDYPSSLEACIAIIDTDDLDFAEEEINLDDFKVLVSEEIGIEPQVKLQLDLLRRSLEIYSRENEAELPSLFGFLRKTYLSRFISQE